MKNLLITLLLFGLIAEKPAKETTVSDPQFTGGVPRLTTDNAGNPMLSWIEKDGDKGASFYFATWQENQQAFGQKIRVKAPANLSVHAEGMPKIAQKADGTLVAIFEVPRPTEQSRFAGDLLYTMSVDKGQTWMEPKPIHQDATPGKSHSFADLTRLPNGEVGAVWLDEKLANQEGSGLDGRPVVFAQTTKGAGFGSALLVDENACQCCRTNVFVDAQQRIHLTYRDLLPSTKTGVPASRDISTVISSDGGKTFSKPQVIYADHWQVNACPHAGPVVAQAGNSILTTWFSGKENAAGLRLAQLGSNKLVASVLSNRAKHPQIASSGGRLIWVWDEAVAKDNSGELGSFVQRIGMRTMDGEKMSETTYLTPTSIDATYPAVLATAKGTLVAYEQTKDKQPPVIVVQWLKDL